MDSDEPSLVPQWLKGGAGNGSAYGNKDTGEEGGLATGIATVDYAESCTRKRGKMKLLHYCAYAKPYNHCAHRFA
jgi:hypothetical protein